MSVRRFSSGERFLQIKWRDLMDVIGVIKRRMTRSAIGKQKPKWDAYLFAPPKKLKSQI
jgi:hypothetical protein